MQPTDAGSTYFDFVKARKSRLVKLPLGSLRSSPAVISTRPMIFTAGGQSCADEKRDWEALFKGRFVPLAETGTLPAGSPLFQGAGNAFTAR
jgi:hypothetical protein